MAVGSSRPLTLIVCSKEKKDKQSFSTVFVLLIVLFHRKLLHGTSSSWNICIPVLNFYVIVAWNENLWGNVTEHLHHWLAIFRKIIPIIWREINNNTYKEEVRHVFGDNPSESFSLVRDVDNMKVPEITKRAGEKKPHVSPQIVSQSCLNWKWELIGDTLPKIETSITRNHSSPSRIPFRWGRGGAQVWDCIWQVGN